MYEKFECDKNQIRVRVENVYNTVIHNVIDILNDLCDYVDELDRQMAVEHLYIELWKETKKFHRKLLIEKIALIVIDDPESVYNQAGLKIPTNLTRTEAVKTTLRLYSNVPLSVILDTIVNILQNK